MANMIDAAVDDTEITGNAPLILGFVSDLYFAAKIEIAAKKINYQVVWFEQEVQTALQNPETRTTQLTEQVTGSGFLLFEKITSMQPVLILIDLGNATLPWREWLPLIKSAPATRRIPIICFGPHVDGESLKYARSAGADIVLARSAFAQELPGILQRNARIPDIMGLVSACSESLSPLAVKGLEEFNRGEYFQAHESLEEAWNQDDSVGRELYRAILQVAVAYLQIERGNYPGAIKMFLRSRQWLDPLPDICRGVDIATLRMDADRAQAELLKTGMHGMQHFDRTLLKPVIYSI
jgi:hypothetical protein